VCLPMSTHLFQPNGGSDGETDVWTSVGTQSGSASVPISRARTPVLVGVETSEASIALTASPQLPEPVSRTRTPVGSIGRAVSPKPEGSPSKQKAAVASESETMPKTATQDSEPPNTSTLETEFVSIEPTTKGKERQAVDETQTSPPCITTSAGAEIATSEQQQDLRVEALADGLDPLGIGDVKDHVPQSKRAQNAQDRRREQMDMLLS